MENKPSKKIKQIGMLTFHQCHNYGAMLCAYALQQAVSSLGHKSEYIDLENDIFEEHGKRAGHQLYRRRDVKAWEYMKKYQGDLKKRWELFENFKKRYLKCSHPIRNMDELESWIGNYGLLLVGGDQLWNEELPVSLDAFVIPFMANIKRVSFGTSMGDAKEMSLRRRIYLKKFCAIGVREKTAAEYIGKYTGVPVTTTVDPVFLLKKDQWEALAVDPEEKGYIFAYLFNKDEADFEKRIRQLDEISKRSEKKIIVCASDGFKETERVVAQIAIGPREWLGYVANADFVVTNSFHGTAFSLIFEKDFICLDADCRKTELLSLCMLQNRFCKGLEDYGYEKNKEINYHIVKERLHGGIKRSYEFLQWELG